jgi:hypothetical protein
VDPGQTWYLGSPPYLERDVVGEAFKAAQKQSARSQLSAAQTKEIDAWRDDHPQQKNNVSAIVRHLTGKGIK